jgi:hypothetical protein
MNKCLRAVFVMCALPAASLADDKDQSPPAPEGWKWVIVKDGTYRFLYPKQFRSLGLTSRKFTVRGIRGEVQMNYGTLHDGTLFDVQGATFTGRGLSGLKVEDLYDIMIEDDKQQGYAVGASKETTLGKFKAREYRMRRDDLRCRTIFFVVSKRVFEMKFASLDESKLDSDQANTFFQSFTILKESPEAESKEEADKAEERAKEAMEKFGFKWTLKLEEMTAPDKPVIGLIHGREFKPDSVVREAGGIVRFRQGAGTPAEAEVRIIMFTSPKDKFENRTIEVKSGRRSSGDPTIILTTKDPSTRVPTTDSFFDKYAMKLNFGAKGPDGMVPCTIYLCASDAKKSFMAGKFTLAVK